MVGLKRGTSAQILPAITNLMRFVHRIEQRVFQMEDGGPRFERIICDIAHSASPADGAWEGWYAPQSVSNDMRTSSAHIASHQLGVGLMRTACSRPFTR